MSKPNPTVLVFDGEEIHAAPDMIPSARHVPISEHELAEWIATVRLACSDETVAYVDAGYRRCCKKYGWSDTPYRDQINAASREGAYERENAL